MYCSYSNHVRLIRGKLIPVVCTIALFLCGYYSCAITNVAMLPHSLTLVIDTNWHPDEPVEIKLDPYLFYYDDSAGSLTYEELLIQPDLFKPYSKSNQDFRVRWLSLTLLSEINARWYLCLNAATVDYYIQTDENGWISGRNGTHIKTTSDHQRLMAMPNIAINLARGVTTKVLLRTTPRAFTIEANRQKISLPQAEAR